MNYQVDEHGYYGNFGGAFIPELLHENVKELQKLSQIFETFPCAETLPVCVLSDSR